MTTLSEQLETLKQNCAFCRKCVLGPFREDMGGKLVFERGNPDSRIMVVGEAPGADEAESGEPFVGKSGQLLSKFFAEVELDTNRDLYITNTIKCRPPNNRPPTDDELLLCMPWLEEQITLIQPAFIVAVGNSALAWFSGERGITKKRGKWFRYKGIPVLPIYHPSYLLRQEYLKDDPKGAWQQTRNDLMAIAVAYHEDVFLNADDV